jgi:hypothetical protein
MAESGEVYRKFITAAGRVAHSALRRSEKPRLNRTEMGQLVDDAIGRLQSQQAVAAIELAWQHLDQQTARLLMRELELITSMHQEGDSDGTEDVTTGKESLEDILGDWLPDWLKHPLKILNEILKLVK